MARHAAALRSCRTSAIHTQLKAAIALEQHDAPKRHSPAYRFRLRQPLAYQRSRGYRMLGWLRDSPDYPAYRPAPSTRYLSATLSQADSPSSTLAPSSSLSSPPSAIRSSVSRDPRTIRPSGQPIPAAASPYPADALAARYHSLACDSLYLAGEADTPNIREQHLQTFTDYMDRYNMLVAQLENDPA